MNCILDKSKPSIIKTASFIHCVNYYLCAFNSFYFRPFIPMNSDRANPFSFDICIKSLKQVWYWRAYY